MFRALVEKNPNNADYRVRWGRLYLDHLAAGRCRRTFSTKRCEFKKTTPAPCWAWR